MDNYTSWKSLAKDFKKREIIDAFFGGFSFATLLYLPLLVVLLEMVTVYMYRLVFLSIVIIISLFLYIFILHYFWKKSLNLKKAEIKTDLTKLFTKNVIIINSFILVLGILFIVFMIPILWA